MKQIGTQASRRFRQVVTMLVAFAMVVASLAVSPADAQAAKKVKKVTIGVKVGSGILVLKKGQSKKLNVSVTPKKANKKVTYKSSNKKAVSVSSKGVVKALKKSGSAKITVTSQQNKKKKATIKVKIGTPIKKVKMQKTATVKWSSANWVMIEKNGQKQKHYPSYTEKVPLKGGAFEVMAGRTITLKTSLSPKKPTYKKLKWTSSKSSRTKLIANGSSCTVSIKGTKPGSVTITAAAMDGSGKKAKVKLKITQFVTDKTPAPTEPPDTRKLTKVEDFEGYAPGTAWDKYTSAGKNSGTMTVVTDPENPENKCLEVKYNGPDAAYDFAPVFNVDLSKLKDTEGKSAEGKTLSSYTGLNADLRIVGNDGDVTYKTIYAYFDQYGKIEKSDKFAASDNKSGSAHVNSSGAAVPAGDPSEDKSLRFGLENSHATGSDAEVGKKLWNGNETKEKAKYMPSYHESVWKMEDNATWFAKDSAMTGFKPNETCAKVGFAMHSLTIDQTRVKEMDATLLDQGKFDVVFGSTYAGNPTYSKIVPPTSVTLYIDNVSLAEEVTPITGFDLSVDGEAKVAPGGVLPLTVKYTPENTSQKGLDWTTDNDKVTVDAAAKVCVAEDFVFAPGEMEKKVVVTATSKANPALTKSIEVTVYQVEAAAEPLVITYDMLEASLSDTAVKAEDGTVTDPGVTVETDERTGREGMKMKFTGNNQKVFFKLPELVDLSAYKSIEIEGYVPAQMALEAWNADVDKSVDKWYEKCTMDTYPFYLGSHTVHLEDGTPVGDLGVELGSYDLNENKNSDFSKTAYITIGTNKLPDDDWEEVTYFIYSIKLIPRQPGDAENASPSVEVPSGGAVTAE